MTYGIILPRTQSPERDVHRVLPVCPDFMSAPLLTPFDEKFSMKSSILLPLAQQPEQVVRSVQPAQAGFVARCIIQLLTKNP